MASGSARKMWDSSGVKVVFERQPTVSSGCCHLSKQELLLGLLTLGCNASFLSTTRAFLIITPRFRRLILGLSPSLADFVYSTGDFADREDFWVTIVWIHRHAADDHLSRSDANFFHYLARRIDRQRFVRSYLPKV